MIVTSLNVMDYKIARCRAFTEYRLPRNTAVTNLSQFQLNIILIRLSIFFSKIGKPEELTPGSSGFPGLLPTRRCDF